MVPRPHLPHRDRARDLQRCARPHLLSNSGAGRQRCRSRSHDRLLLTCPAAHCALRRQTRRSRLCHSCAVDGDDPLDRARRSRRAGAQPRRSAHRHDEPGPGSAADDRGLPSADPAELPGLGPDVEVRLSHARRLDRSDDRSACGRHDRGFDRRVTAHRRCPVVHDRGLRADTGRSGHRHAPRAHTRTSPAPMRPRTPARPGLCSRSGE